MGAVRNLLEGRPLGAPLHPALVHLPIALLPLSVLLDVGSRIWPRPELFLARGAFICLAAGLVTGLLAAAFGFVDYSDLRRDHLARKAATRHMVLNVIALALFGGSAWLRRDALTAAQTSAGPLALSLAGLALLGYAGYLGGDLVYNDGVAVGRHRRPTPLPEDTIRKQARGTRVEVADESALREGGTLRVSVGGTIVTIARTREGLHAFQEFCTHRYGPLSEGRLEGCEVVCPWHRSRFDLRTGAVAHGPAREPLRTFKVEARDGKIWLEVPPEH